MEAKLNEHGFAPNCVNLTVNVFIKYVLSTSIFLYIVFLIMNDLGFLKILVVLNLKYTDVGFSVYIYLIRIENYSDALIYLNNTEIFFDDDILGSHFRINGKQNV